MIPGYSIEVAGQTHRYTIRHSLRARHVAVHVDAWSGIEVVVPSRLSLAAGEMFLYEKRVWLERTMRRVGQLKIAQPRAALASGSVLTVLGRVYVLQVAQVPQRRRARIEARNNTLAIRLPQDRPLRPVVASWLATQARRYFTAETARLAKRLSVSRSGVRVGEHSSQWGSCSRSGRLSFNWRLVLAPEPVARYVAIHETVHLAHHNHSPEYWQLVARFDALYREHRRWLHEHQRELIL